MLAAAGAEVVLTGRGTERLKDRAATLAGAPLIVPGDLRDAAFRAALIDTGCRNGTAAWTCC